MNRPGLYGAGNKCPVSVNKFLCHELSAHGARPGNAVEVSPETDPDPETCSSRNDVVTSAELCTAGCLNLWIKEELLQESASLWMMEMVFPNALRAADRNQT